VGLYIVLDRRPQEARLIQDLIVGGVYLGVTLSIIGFVFGAPVGTLVATSGVVTIILCRALTRPDESHLVTLAIRIAADRQPSAIEAILKTALDDCRCIVQDPKPGVALKGIDAMAIDVELQFRVTSPANRTPARNEIIDVVSQRCAAEGSLSPCPHYPISSCQRPTTTR
jgi:hypothetical protein